MIFFIFFLALFLFLFCLLSLIIKEHEEAIIYSLMSTVVVFLIWLLMGFLLTEKIGREDVITKTDYIVYNKNVDGYVYMTQDCSDYKLINETSLGDIIQYDKEKSDVIYSDENIVETHALIPTNQRLKKIFGIPDEIKYIIKTKEVKMILN